MESRVNPIETILGKPLPPEGGEATLQGVRYVMSKNVLRQAQLMKPVQQDMADFYELHWKLPGAYDSEASDSFQVELFRTMFPGFENIADRELRQDARVLDVGCGSAWLGGRSSARCSIASIMSASICHRRSSRRARTLIVCI